MAAGDRAFPGRGQRLDSEPSAVAVAKKAGSTRLIGASINSSIAQAEVDAHVSAFMDVKRHKELCKRLKRDVRLLNMENTNIQKLSCLFWGDATFEVVRGGTKLQGGIMLGSKEDYEHAAHNDTSITAEDGKTCKVTYIPSNIKGGSVEEVFRLLPVSEMRGIVLSIERYDHTLLSDEKFPSFTDLFWSIGYHGVDQRKKEYEPRTLADVFKKLWPEEDWGDVDSLNVRNAKKKKGKYTG